MSISKIYIHGTGEEMGIHGMFGLSDASLLNEMSQAVHTSENQSFIDDKICFLSDGPSDEPCINCNKDETLWIAFVGNIYNASILSDLLLKHGTNGDTAFCTDILLHLYELYNKDFIKYVQGNFSCSIWDKNKNDLLIIREDVHYPIYYIITNNTIIFSSTINSLLKYSKYVRKLNRQVLGYMFSLGYVPGEQTLFKGINKLPPYHMLRFNNGTKSVENYWKIIYMPQDRPEDHVVDETYRIISDSVKLRIEQSKGPFGILLSGGLDSCITASLMKKNIESIKAITVQYDEGTASEPQALHIAEWLGIPVYERILNDRDMINILSELAKLHDELVIDYIHVLIPSYSGVEHAGKHVKTLFTGDGGDAVFWGFPAFYHWEDLLLWCSKIPLTLRKQILYPFLENLPAKACNDKISLIKLLMYVSSLPKNEQLLYSGRLFDESELVKLFSDNTLHVELDQTNEYLSNIISESSWINNANWVNNIYKRYYLYISSSASYGTPSEIRYAPVCSKFSVNICTPFCDKTVKELGSSLPLKYKQPCKNSSKYILRKVALKYNLLPKEFIKTYNKSGFSSPVETWIKGDTKELIAQETIDNLQMCDNIFTEAYIERLLKTNRSRHILSVYLFLLWYDNYFQNNTD